MMHFPLFQISPLFSKKFLTFWKISESLPFPDKISYFHPPKFLTTFFRISTPVLPVLLHFPSDSRKFIIPPYFSKFPPCFRKIQQLFTYFTCNFFPPTLTMMHL